MFYGNKDPRIVKIENVNYLPYCTYDEINALGSLATSIDLIHFEKKGLLFLK